MRTHTLRLAVAALLSGVSVAAGSFTSDFSNPNQAGFTLNGGYLADEFTPYPAIENGHLAITYAENNLQGSIVLDDLDGGMAIEGFTARFKLQLGPGSGNAADGTAFCFGPDINSYSVFNEEGTGNGVIVAFDIYDNGGGEAPAIDVKYGGVTLAHTSFAKADLVTGKFEDVFIEVTRSGVFNMAYKGQVLYTNLVLPDFAPTAGQFAIGSRTGGENANQWLDDLNVTTGVADVVVKPAITSDPQPQTVPEGANATFAVGFDGSAPLTFSWYKNNTLIDGVNGPTLILNAVSFADNQAKIKCEVGNTAGTAASKEAILTVVQDLTPPTLVSAKGSADFLGAVLTFSEPVADASGGDKANYTIAGLTVNSATVLGSNVVLATSQQAEGATYTVVVNNVKDQSVAGNLIAANSQVQFQTFAFMLGTVLHKKYDNIDDNTGSNPENLFSDPRFPSQPDRADLMSAYEYPANGVTRVPADPVRNYFDTLEGFFIPPTTGDYVFFIAGADRFWLYLSTDENPANKRMVTGEPAGWSDARGWLQMYSGNLEDRRSDLSLLNTWPTAPYVNLKAGQRYYMMEVHHDGSWSGGDYFAATYKLESEADPANATAPRLTGGVVGTYIDPTGSSVKVTQQPANATQAVGRTAVFTVAAAGTSAYGGTVSYQWQRQPPGGTTWADLAGAAAASYETPVLTLADNGAKYRAACSVPGIVIASDAATLTVVSDSIPPQLAGVGAVPSQTGTTFDVGVSFDEKVDPVSAGNMANYSLSAGAISGIKFHDGSPGVVLTVSGLTAGSAYTVTVTNVKDLFGNAMTATVKEFKVSGMKWGVVGGDELALGNGVLATAENGFDVYSDGIGEWGTYDEATFVYEQVTGDFDKVVRVEFQDSASQWARAGLVVRDVTNFGVDRATQEGGAAGRYQKVHVNPVKTAMGTAGNNSWEANRRLDTGGATTSAGGGGTPPYPNAWCRLQRVGDLFTVFRSDDGVTWTQLGTTTFTTPMPATVYVGPEYSPENGNLAEDSGLRGAWLAKFRDYGNFSVAVTPTISVNSATGVITYTGTLVSSTTVKGTYAPVAGATSPYTVPKTGTAMFYQTSQ